MWAVVPIKGFDAPKQRLAEVLSPEERGALAEHMLSDVLAALSDLEGVVVISRDEEALNKARWLGARVMSERQPGGYSAAVRQAGEVLAGEGVDAMMHVPGDVPLITPDEVAQIANLSPAAPGACVVPSRDHDGTNCLALWPPDLFQPAFGPDSFHRHCQIARDSGVEPTILELDGFALDIDMPDDLRLFCAGGHDCGSLRYLHTSGIAARLARI
ncbi:MAG: 2-phospho-L-lactate guanylyltransferase [Rhodospirillaceae bacterium]|jgi:2-phospho-L-lactate guanylyltransferase|nr:2-phospho-L-lactate guanylyltransferase [Rhodospirillaceae bacterium]MBT3491571.1 2-phospho-L-lactate guanylyltransferase [Rhodospirillaceae bacterium]MBT3780681.1 2-phospho-L-lactate guanylyltransferase [Rhodospirillaceae bacterium]MBT3976109.1 2-phospho-L-lactate guanylyltransferase [Rhodospirillaceae bacterium]MBT4170455.1 2-phospho-L-lactate guanylyltransferase [Rhodospirillaceae bacterium]